MLSALFSAVRSPRSSVQTPRRVLPRNLNARHPQWCRWTSTLDGRMGRRLMLTLNPERYSSVGQEVLDISNESEVVLYSKGTSGQQEPIRLRCSKRTGDRFPPNTLGLFYGHGKTKRNIRSIRFRLCSSVDNFHKGSDLRQSDGQVWSLSLSVMALSPIRNRPLLHLIKSDYPDDDSWLSQRHSVLSLSSQHIVDKGGSVLDISNKTKSLPKFKTGTSRFEYQRRTGPNGKLIYAPFPPDTRGVFYYKQSATAPTAIGELRFRLCSDVSLFHAGKDLCLPSGLPWCIHSHFILVSPVHEALRQQLFDEGLLSPAAKSFVNETGMAVLHGLTQPFAVNIGSSATTLVFQIGTKRTIHEIMYLFIQAKSGSPLYTGRAVVQFEEYPSKYVNPDAKRRPLFALRFLEFLTPVTTIPHPDIGSVQHPEQGQFLKRKTKSGIYKTWGYTPYKASTQAMLSEWAKQPPSQEWQSLKVDSHSHFDAP